jgi:hypothetical protein
VKLNNGSDKSRVHRNTPAHPRRCYCVGFTSRGIGYGRNDRELAPWSSVSRILSSWDSSCCFACAVLATRFSRPTLWTQGYPQERCQLFDSLEDVLSWVIFSTTYHFLHDLHSNSHIHTFYQHATSQISSGQTAAPVPYFIPGAMQ